MNYLEYHFQASARERELLLALLQPLKPLGFEERADSLVAYFDPAVRRDVEVELRERVWRVVGHTLQWRVEEQAYEDWASSWKKDYHALSVGKRFWIYPSWEKDAIPADKIAIAIDPGMSFGTGLHESTQLCLCAMEQPGFVTEKTSVLDVGCGTGLLAIAAVKLGAPDVWGIDNDPQCVEDAQLNALQNNVAVTVSDQPLAQLEKSFDRVVANLLLDLHLELAPDYARVVKPGGRLVLAGLLIEQEKELQVFEARPWRWRSTARKNEWLLVELERLERPGGFAEN